MARSIELHNKGKKIGLNDFTKNVLIGVIVGAAKALRGVDINEEIVVTIGKEE